MELFRQLLVNNLNKIKNCNNKLKFFLLLILFIKIFKIVWKIYIMFLILNLILFVLKIKNNASKPIFIFNKNWLWRLSENIVYMGLNKLNFKKINLKYLILNILINILINCTIMLLDVYIEFTMLLSEDLEYDISKSIEINISDLIYKLYKYLFYAFYNKYKFLEI